MILKLFFKLSNKFMIIASETSFLVCSMARIFAIYTHVRIYIFQAVHRAVNVLNVSTCI